MGVRPGECSIKPERPVNTVTSAASAQCPLFLNFNLSALGRNYLRHAAVTRDLAGRAYSPALVFEFRRAELLAVRIRNQNRENRLGARLIQV